MRKKVFTTMVYGFAFVLSLVLFPPIALIRTIQRAIQSDLDLFDTMMKGKSPTPVWDLYMKGKK